MSVQYDLHHPVVPTTGRTTNEPVRDDAQPDALERHAQQLAMLTDIASQLQGICDRLEAHVGPTTFAVLTDTVRSAWMMADGAKYTTKEALVTLVVDAQRANGGRL